MEKERLNILVNCRSNIYTAKIQCIEAISVLDMRWNFGRIEAFIMRINDRGSQTLGRKM